MIVRSTPMPAYWAALGLMPTVRTSKPKLVRRRMNHTTTQSPSITKPEVERRLAVHQLGQPGAVGDGRGAGHRGAHVAQDHRVLRAHHPADEQHRDAVEHDRDDHLVGAGRGLEHAGDEAVEPAADDAGEQDDRDQQDRRAVRPASSKVPTQAAIVAPTRSWPSAPMLNSPARKANATASAAPMNGVERPREAAMRSERAEHAPQQRPVGLDRVLADEQDDHAADRPGRAGSA